MEEQYITAAKRLVEELRVEKSLDDQMRDLKVQLKACHDSIKASEKKLSERVGPNIRQRVFVALGQAVVVTWQNEDASRKPYVSVLVTDIEQAD